ncbi:hypothetical protein GLOTRDRAFT_111142 [Gloeophyllum trabeum ATCC 11539]|uniref:Cupredoxin n=1 Tax=Gloeophyllum trabeum (strain ATCC 11539 / FP-39264 / Madison 617) TaxID=670483 RepID=S7Q549_GLOTA|nr:uncharacterized protein GLOTRDRAFT_111142 [Gloeophyllum trabeum ATCC 11539]EPQ55156.1 hypothetical protein GLOTRDRAFT_111142 [Gloeophyllum trabeum ATCC 11539]
MRAATFAIAALTAASAASAANIVITVGGNTTSNASLVFQPQRVTAQVGDTVIFNFTQGNHTATQAVFSEPCIPAHDANITINGFDSGFRDAGNGTAITILSVPILPENVNQTMWFYDYNLCGQGGVGVINDNESSYETLAGFERNAIRLNGTGAHSSSASHSATRTATSATGSSTSHSSSADRAVKVGSIAALPLALAGLALSL